MSTPSEVVLSSTTVASQSPLEPNCTKRNAIETSSWSQFTTQQQAVPPYQIALENYYQQATSMGTAGIADVGPTDQLGEVFKYLVSMNTSEAKRVLERVVYPDQDHILRAHTDSYRNAIIYIVVVLSVYIFGVTCIAVQYYRKHSTLNPFQSYAYEHNRGNRHGQRDNFQRSTASGVAATLAAKRKARRQSNMSMGVAANNSLNGGVVVTGGGGGGGDVVAGSTGYNTLVGLGRRPGCPKNK